MTERMSKKNIKRIVLLLVVGFCVFVVYSVVSLFIPRQGTVNNVSDLKRIFRQADCVTEASFTNSIIQKLPFNGAIHYRLILFKEPLLVLRGGLNTNTLPAFIRANTNATFVWRGAGNEIEEGWPDAQAYPAAIWTNITFRSEIPVEVAGVGTYAAGVQGEIDLRSGSIAISSGSSDGPVRMIK